MNRNISFLEAIHIARLALSLEDLPDELLEVMVLKFNGEGLEKNWEDFRKKIDMEDERIKGILQVCKLFKYLEEGGEIRNLPRRKNA